MSLKILAPVKNTFEIKSLSAVGCDEFYCGVRTVTGSSLNDITNRRCRDDLAVKCNFKSWQELELAIKSSHRLNKKIYVALNENYTRLQLNKVLTDLERIIELNPDGLIVTDINLMLKLKKICPEMPFHVSMLSSIFNSEAVKFYQELGASRIIFPRCIFTSELKKIKELCPGIELEVFTDFFVYCPEVEGFCSSIHHLNPLMPALCGRDYLYCQKKDSGRGGRNSTCHLCNIYDYKDIGIDVLKLTGREYTSATVHASTYIIKKLVEISTKSHSKEEFVKTVNSIIEPLIEQAVKVSESLYCTNNTPDSGTELREILSGNLTCKRYGLEKCYFQKERS